MAEREAERKAQGAANIATALPWPHTRLLWARSFHGMAQEPESIPVLASVARARHAAGSRWVRPLTTLCLLCSLACGEAPEAGDVDRAGGTDESGAAEADPQLAFWEELQELCGLAFEGRVVESVPPDESFEGQRLVMHVRTCDVAEIRVPFHVGEDRSRTWVITPTATGLRLKHDHRHEDGSEDEVTQYGGDTPGRGEATAQEFHADAYTAELIAAAATNVWTIELHPDSVFVYALRREGSDRRFRAEFDLTRPVAPPPPPW